MLTHKVPVKLGGLVKALLVVLSVCAMSCNSPSNEDVERQIASSSLLRKVDSLCSSLPAVPTLHLKYKRLSGNSGISSITFFYSKSIPFDDVMQTYSKWLETNGWEKNTDLLSTSYGNYRKGNEQISIELMDADTLAIDCMTENP